MDLKKTLFIPFFSFVCLLRLFSECIINKMNFGVVATQYVRSNGLSLFITTIEFVCGLNNC
jgi:hypothetical protein